MKNFIKNSFYLILCTSFVPVLSMQQPAGKYGIEFAKKLISKSCTAAHWGISVGPFIPKGLVGIGVGMFDEKICNKINAMDSGICGSIKDSEGNITPIYGDKYFDLVASSVQEFTNEQAKKVSLHETPSVRIIPKGIFCAGALQNVIMIKSKYNTALVTALEINDENKKNEAAGILQHELTHVKNKDTLIKGMESVTVPLLTHPLIKSMNKVIPFTQKVAPFWLQQTMKLSSGVGKYALNSIILKASSRRKERRADNGICDDIATLEATRDWFIEIKEKYEPQQTNSLKEKLNYYLFADHPTIDDRIAKFDQRIEKLKNTTI